MSSVYVRTQTGENIRLLVEIVLFRNSIKRVIGRLGIFMQIYVFMDTRIEIKRR